MTIKIVACFNVYMIKRVVLFLVVNFLVVATISIILSLLNVKPYLQSYGIDYMSLLIFCLIWGFAGAFISLALSRSMAKWMLGVRIVESTTNDPSLKQLVNVVHDLARSAHLPDMPEVGIYDSPEVNAFATGPSRKRSLVAVSTGLLNKMSAKELEGVLGHEITHIANGDMVTMTLVQGIVNAFVMFLARVLAFIFSGIGQSREKSSSSSYFAFNAFVFIFEIVFMILGSLVIAFYSRFREFRADKGGAYLAGRDKMISALEALQRHAQIRDARVEKPAFQSMKISHQERGGLRALFATHPPLSTRIDRLKQEI